MKLQTDILIIGAGIIGMTLAHELLIRKPSLSVVIIDKEKDIALHGSGRNSGVLHAGFYYTADSLKARFTRKGNLCMRAFCHTNNLPVNECGKVVVATQEDELDTLYELEKRGLSNGVAVSLIDEKELAEIRERFGDATIYKNPEQFAELQQTYNEKNTELDLLYQAYERRAG